MEGEGEDVEGESWDAEDADGDDDTSCGLSRVSISAGHKMRSAYFCPICLFNPHLQWRARMWQVQFGSVSTPTATENHGK